MGFWKFTRGTATIDRVTRIVSVTLSDGAVMRGKLILQLEGGHSQDVVDVVGDWATSYAAVVLADFDTASVVACEARVSAELRRAFPRSLPGVRSINLTAVHVLEARAARPASRGEGPSPEVAPARAERAAIAPESSSQPARLAESGAPARSHTPPPARSGTRAIAISPESLAQAAAIAVEHGAFGDAAIAALTSASRDAMLRLTLGSLRAEAAVTRGRPPAVAHAWIASLVAFPGAEPLHVAWDAELSRWRSAHGAYLVDAVCREAAVASAYLLFDALLDAGVSGRAAARGVESACRAAFPDLDVPSQLGRYVFAADTGVDAELARAMSTMLGAPAASGPMRALLGPLLQSLRAQATSSVGAARAATG